MESVYLLGSLIQTFLKIENSPVNYFDFKMPVVFLSEK